MKMFSITKKVFSFGNRKETNFCCQFIRKYKTESELAGGLTGFEAPANRLSLRFLLFDQLVTKAGLLPVSKIKEAVEIEMI